MESMFDSNGEHPIFQKTCKAVQGGRPFGFGENVFGQALAGVLGIQLF